MALIDNNEHVSILFSLSALVASSLLLIASLYHLYMLEIMRRKNNIARVRDAFEKTKKALRCARWSAVEIAVLATQAGMTLEEIEEEYKKDASSRAQVLMSILGSRTNYFVRKFVQCYPSRFLRSGYKLEQQFLKKTEQKVDQIRTAISG
ncbi:hypothetical protein RB195_020801 [Necator americanus]|uniref:Uncharacterized protein n=1 Tax=Necator americanus TaxID=51031 RepID=A0ABR1CKL1_NECAM